MTVPETVEVTVRSEGRFIETSACSRHDLANGHPGVLWRGMPYPLLANDVIELIQPAMEPAVGSTIAPTGQSALDSFQGMECARHWWAGAWVRPIQLGQG